MSVLDKFLNAMKLNDDDDYDDDEFLDDEADEYEEERPKKRFFNKADDDDDYDDYDEYDRKPQKARTQNQNKGQHKAKSTRQPQNTNSKVSPMRPRKSGSSMEVCVIKPRSMEDAHEITETLLANCTVVLNMEGLDMEIAQRIIDFTSGSCYAINGNLQKVSNYIFIITPSGVDVSGDFQEKLSGSFDVPPLRTNY